MDKLKFTVYDIFGYVIPGLVLIWFAKVFERMVSCATLSASILDYQITLADTLIFLPLAYVIGHLLHAVTKELNIPSKDSLLQYLQNWSNKNQSDLHRNCKDDKANEQNKHDNRKQYFPPDLSLLKKCIQNVFEIDTNSTENLTKIELADKYYWACNVYVLKHHPDSITETFYGLFGFYRSMFIVAFLIGVVFLLYTLIPIISSLVLWKFLLSSSDFVIGIIALLALLSSQFFRSRIKDFNDYHYAAVFTDFIVIALEKTPKEEEKQKYEERFTICERLIRCLSSIYSGIKKESAKSEE
ncbi:MAG: hypothetical protein KAR44_07640 [Candidatus Aegiribacteria sp.]|nr:hypothetical protein [Candidatus Aegiribacteria sp.]